MACVVEQSALVPFSLAPLEWIAAYDERVDDLVIRIIKGLHEMIPLKLPHVLHRDSPTALTITFAHAPLQLGSVVGGDVPHPTRSWFGLRMSMTMSFTMACVAQ